MAFHILDLGRSRPPGWTVPLLLALCGAWGWACQETGNGDSADGMDAGDGGGLCDLGEDADVRRRAILSSVATNVIAPATDDFAAVAGELPAVVSDLELALASDAANAAAELSAAQEAWTRAMEQWQRLEVMQVGPAAPSISAVAGENMRDSIYSWPTIDTCRVDRNIAEEAYLEDDFLATELVYAYGLDALEYLLFVHDSGHTCPPQVQLDGTWAAISFEEIERRRAAYAHVLATGVADRARVLATRWAADGDDFASLLANPGSGDSPFDNEMQALDDVFRAMFYIDLKTKDAKLARPLGLAEGCASAPCPDLLESPHAHAGARWVKANLEGLRLMLQGGADPASADGFDDLLREVEGDDIADTLLEDLDAAITQAGSFEDPLQQVLLSDMARVEALHASVKNVTDTLKGPFVMCLMLSVPAEGAGDAD